MNKRFFLIHGWEGSPEGCWRAWLKEQLEKKGHEVVLPAMPNSAEPVMEEWVEHLHKTVGEANKNCYFIGHSLGCIGILRYLESLNEETKISGVILVAGFTSNLGYDELDSFFQTKINWNKLNKICKNYIVLHSDNDYYVSLHYGDIFKDKLNAKLVVKEGMGHFSDTQNIKELPVMLELTQELYKSQY